MLRTSVLQPLTTNLTLISKAVVVNDVLFFICLLWFCFLCLRDSLMSFPLMHIFRTSGGFIVSWVIGPNFIRLRQAPVSLLSCILLLWNLGSMWEFCPFVTVHSWVQSSIALQTFVLHILALTHVIIFALFTFMDKWSVNWVLQKAFVWYKIVFTTWHVCVWERWLVCVSSLLTTVDVVIAVRLSKLNMCMLIGITLNKNE